MNIYIKNMVCSRCIIAVRDIAEGAGIHPTRVVLGEITVAEAPSAEQLGRFEKRLKEIGFEILSDQKKKTIEKIRNIITGLIQDDNGDHQVRISRTLSSELHKDYSYLSKLFSESEGVTIEQYVIGQKIEKVKELLAYEELNLNEIAFRLGYSSVAHLSAQFKKVTGFTPSAFRKLNDHHRRKLDEI